MAAPILFVFRRDLRLEDNLGLRAALAAGEVVPCFVCDDRQVGEQPYRSDAALQFMGESLVDLDLALHTHGAGLQCFFGIAEEVIPRIAKQVGASAVHFNKDYTPFSRARDAAMEKTLAKHGIACVGHDDALLTVPGAVLSDAGKPYTVYSAFARKARTLEVSRSQALPRGARFAAAPGAVRVAEAVRAIVRGRRDAVARGGRGEGLRMLARITALADYATQRNMPAVEGTSRLSPHHKFGTVSVRETYWAVRDAFGSAHGLIGELYWRDFFTHIAWHFPHVFKGAFRPQYDALPWSTSARYFTAWKEGRTGFPIVDAGMRQLRETGWMHNRVRMITASFLVKDLHIDWREGEKYFATQLVDYDPALNNGNWQWVASTGCDAQPYFRIFNPHEQQKKFDPEGAYIRRWVPEYDTAAYPAPIVDHKIERTKALDAFASVQGSLGKVQ